MKKMHLLLLVLFALSSCTQKYKVQEVIVENRYSLALPAFLAEVNNLNEDASLQYQHGLMEFYVIVIDEDKSMLDKAIADNGLEDIYSVDFEGYASILTNSFEQSLLIEKKSEILDTLINNMPAKIFTLTGEIEGIDIFYSISMLEGKERFYQVMTWTLANREKLYINMMKRIHCSMKELE